MDCDLWGVSGTLGAGSASALDLGDEAPDYRTLVGPPQPLAEVIRARDAARSPG